MAVKKRSSTRACRACSITRPSTRTPSAYRPAKSIPRPPRRSGRKDDRCGVRGHALVLTELENSKRAREPQHAHDVRTANVAMAVRADVVRDDRDQVDDVGSASERRRTFYCVATARAASPRPALRCHVSGCVATARAALQRVGVRCNGSRSDQNR